MDILSIKSHTRTMNVVVVGGAGHVGLARSGYQSLVTTTPIVDVWGFLGKGVLL